MTQRKEARNDDRDRHGAGSPRGAEHREWRPHPGGPGAATGQDKTMTTPTGARTGRLLGRIGRIAAVGAGALLLAGAAAAPAEAMPRSSAADWVHLAIYWCDFVGGDPYVAEIGNSFNFACVFQDGDAYFEDVSYDD
jgi:hypothetical protein